MMQKRNLIYSLARIDIRVVINIITVQDYNTKCLYPRLKVFSHEELCLLSWLCQTSSGEECMMTDLNRCKSWHISVKFGQKIDK